jgi:small-conductance mechanosensitive channel
MGSLKKTAVIAFIMVALLIPVLAISDNAAGEAELTTDSVWQTGGFDDRTNGTIMVRVIGIEESDVITVTITNLLTGRVFATKTFVATINDEIRGHVDVALSFRVSDPGKHFASVKISGDNVSEDRNQMSTLSFEVGRSIWSNVLTYVAIVVVIIIIAIVLLIRMRAAPKVDSAGAFTALESERSEKKSAKKKSTSAKKEEYKGRSKK